MKLNLYSEFILEKKIAEISANIEITFLFDIITTQHSQDRSNFADRGLSADNQSYISNSEIEDFVYYFNREIAKGIALGNIRHDKPFVIKSLGRELALSIVPHKLGESHWKLIITTVFRESEKYRFRTWPGQVVFDK
jgi:hypothetical protein